MVMRISMLKKLKTMVKLAPNNIEGLKGISKLHKDKWKDVFEHFFIHVCMRVDSCTVF